MSGTLAAVTSLGSEVVLYVKIEWLPNGAQNVRFLAGFSRKLIMLCYVRIYCCKSDHVRLLCSQSTMAYNSVDRCQLKTGTRPFPLLHASAVTNTMRHARGAVVFVSLSVRICVPAHLLDRV